MLSALWSYLPDLSFPAAVFVGAVVFAAGVLRGFTGFGFALVAVPAITLLVEPAAVVPAILIVAVVAGAELVPQAWPAVHWPSMRLLLGGAALGTPVGMIALKLLPANTMRVIIGVVVLAMVGLLWRGFKLKAAPPRRTQLGIGMLSGLLNGGTGMGGPPVIIYYLASPEGVAVGRASLLVYFFFLSIWATAVNGVGGLLSVRVLVLAALMVPFMLVGNRIGARWFDKSSAAVYERVALICLAAIACLSLIRALST